jgi:hypothetical protein
VPQGYVLGPELFKIFINDLPGFLNVPCIMYADDLKVWTVMGSVDVADKLQFALNRLDEWSKQWSLPINREKCCVLPIGQHQPSTAFHIGGYLLRESTNERDLGVLVTPDLKSLAETQRKVSAASRLWWAICRSFERITPDIFCVLYVSHI